MQANASELRILRTTAYYQGEITATGKQVREGLAAANREHLGDIAILYKVDEDGEIGEFLGIWEVEDVGFGTDPDGDGIGTMEEGLVIDIYKPDLESCKEWVRETNEKVYVQYIPAKG